MRSIRKGRLSGRYGTKVQNLNVCIMSKRQKNSHDQMNDRD